MAGSRGEAAAERLALVAALREAGPDAPTLCTGWTAHDLAAHVVARERRPDSGPGLVVPLLAPWTERVRRRYRRRDFGDLVELIRTGPPWTSPFAVPAVDEAANLVEFLVHCEDVRRAAPGWRPRALPVDRVEAVRILLVRRAGVLFRRSPVGVTLVDPEGRHVVARKGTPSVSLTGDPVELLLFGVGRGARTRVEVQGPAAAVALLREARLGI